MKHHVLSKALSLTAAAVMMCTAVSGTGVQPFAAAQIPPEQNTAFSVPQHESREPVTVIVKVTGDAVMTQPEALEMGSDYLETDQAIQLDAQYKALQQSVQEQIRAFYPELQVGFSYSALYNGFSCVLPENLIEQVQALPDVVSVTVMEDIAVPQMNQAAALSGFPAYYDYTGCSGEGQVIAVIDSELDYTHPMFAPLAEGIETAVSKEDVAEIVSSGILNRNVDPDRAYISSKLPYVVNYADPDDPYGGISNDLQYHGTHVSGIAAGNTFKTSDGTELSGIARDAQLMFFGVSTPRGYIDGDAGLAAIEDAVKLHADVINMSWGSDNTEYWGNNPFSDAIIAADRAGVIVCNAAGNADNGTYSWGRTVIPENPDTGMISDKAELGSPIMIVASAENSGVAKGDAVLLGEKQIVLMPMMDELGSLFYLSDSLAPGEYEYVDCQNGTDRDFLRAGDLSGRIALVQRFELPATAITANAKAAGASGVILIDQKHPDGMNYIFSTTTSIVINGISWLDGQEMLAAENKTLTITSEPIEREYVSSVSSYTSWGVKASLDLRPDIMGIGGRVRSAAYYSGDCTASGTSMASPYVAGCTAVLRQYLKKLGVNLTGSDFAAYVRRLMMNTAVPYEEDGNFVTPRRQGAGLVSLDKAIAAKVLMTGDAGDAKVNLFDKLGDTFSFDLTLTNYSDEAVTYPQAEIRLTTDGTYYDPELEIDRTAGQQKLNCTSDFTGPVTIAAGETKTVTVSISLDAAQCRKLEEKFKYGFFAEGFILLSGAENSADISIPMLGYHGDWAQIPCSDPETDTVEIQFGDYIDSVPLSIVRTGLLYKQILERVPEEEIYEVIEDPFKSFWFDYDYATKEEKKQLASNAMECWISPNRDSIADAVTGFRYEDGRRFTSRSNAQLLDADGNVLYDGAPGAVANNCEFEKLEEGDYTYMKKSWINYPGSEENPQILNATVHVDKTAPNVKHNYINENGRTYLVITASDDRQLQGLTVSGIGDGGEAGVYQPGNENDIRKRYFVKAMLSRSRTGGTILKDVGYENIANLPFVLRVWGDLAEQAEGDSFDFADVLAAEPDEKGNWTVKYDVTNLKNYSFTVLDEAYNFVEIRSTGNAAEELVAQKGFWAEPDHGYYMIGDNTFTYTSYWDGSVKEYSYTAFGDRLTLVSGNEKKEYTVWGLSDTNYQLKNLDDNTVIDLSRSERNREVYEGKKFIPEKALVEDALRQSNESRDFEMVITRHSLTQGWLMIVINNSDESEGFHQDYYYVNIFNGRGSLTSDLKNCCPRAVLCPEYLSGIPAGLYDYYDNNDTLLRFNEDGKTGVMLVSKQNDDFDIDENTPFTYTIGENGSLTLSCNNRTLNGIVTRNMDNGGIYILFFDPEEDLLMEWVMNLITDDQEKIAKLRSFDEMRQLATAYLNAVMGTDLAPNTTQPAFFDYYLGGAWIGCHIDIDPFTLDVTDDEGNTGNLLNPPKMPENAAYAMDELKDLAAVALKERTGAQAEYVKGLLRNDGSVMIVLRDAHGHVLERYIADPVTGNMTPKQKNRGDVNCDGSVDVADAVLLARMLTEDAEAVVTDEGRDNADCDLDRVLTTEDVSYILMKIAKKIRF